MVCAAVTGLLGAAFVGGGSPTLRDMAGHGNLLGASRWFKLMPEIHALHLEPADTNSNGRAGARN